MKIRIEKPLLKSLTLMASVIEARDAYTAGQSGPPIRPSAPRMG
jgi:hypothetical protein